jgi:hypothetical protein
MKISPRSAFTVAFFFVAFALVAQTAENGPDGSLSDEELFGGSSSVAKDVDSGSPLSGQGLLKSEAVKIGGEFGLNAGGTGDPSKWHDYPDSGSSLEAFADSALSLFADARPSEEIRFFVKGDIALSSSTDAIGEIREAFADIQPIDDLCVRAGKQTANWGIGYFFSPGNLLDLSSIDPEDPTAERTGPLAVKMQKPVGTDTYYAYFLLDDAMEGKAIDIAPKAEWLFGTTELTLGGRWGPNNPWAATCAVTFPLFCIDAFAEFAMKGNEDKKFLVEDPAVPLGLSAEADSTALFFLGTVGFCLTKQDNARRGNLALSAQYYYNGEGYRDTGVYEDNVESVAALYARGAITSRDLMERGMHYGAALLSVDDILGSDMGFSLFWLGNLSDESGTASVTVKWSRFDHVLCSLAYARTYGTSGSEYAPDGPRPKLTLKISLNNTTF